MTVYRCRIDESAGLEDDLIEDSRETLQFALDLLLAHNTVLADNTDDPTRNLNVIAAAHRALDHLVKAAHAR